MDKKQEIKRTLEKDIRKILEETGVPNNGVMILDSYEEPYVDNKKYLKGITVQGTFEMYSNNNKKELGSFIAKMPNGIPTHGTFSDKPTYLTLEYDGNKIIPQETRWMGIRYVKKSKNDIELRKANCDGEN